MVTVPEILPVVSVPENSAYGFCSCELWLWLLFGSGTWEFCLHEAGRRRRGHKWSPRSRWAPARETHCIQHRSTATIIYCSISQRGLRDCFPLSPLPTLHASALVWPSTWFDGYSACRNSNCQSYNDINMKADNAPCLVPKSTRQ